jgi:hypothetical protein
VITPSKGAVILVYSSLEAPEVGVRGLKVGLHQLDVRLSHLQVSARHAFLGPLLVKLLVSDSLTGK